MSDDLYERTQALNARADLVRRILTHGDYSAVADRVGYVSNEKRLAMIAYHHHDGDTSEHDDDQSDDEYVRTLRTLTDEGWICQHHGIEIEDNSVLVKERSLAAKIDEATARTLFKDGSVAPFGDLIGQKTRVDEDVRKAVYYAAEDATAKFNPLNSARKEFSEFIEKFEKIFGYNCKCKFSKMNIYGPGGFFAPHVDHVPSKTNTVGTIVMILASEFEGGELRVSNGPQFTGPEDQDVITPAKPGTCSIVAFPGFCPHSVEEVKSGYRITLTWNIIKEEGKPDSIAYCTDAIDLPVATPHGILLGGKYGPGVIERLGPSALFAQDLMTYEIYKARGISVRLVSVGYHVDASWGYDDCPTGRYGDYSASAVYEIVPARWERIFRASFDNIDEIMDANIDEAKEDRIPFYCVNPAGGYDGAERHTKYKSACAHTGNESEPGELRSIYLGAALIVGEEPEEPEDPESVKRKRADEDGPGAKRAKCDKHGLPYQFAGQVGKFCLRACKQCVEESPAPQAQ